MVQTENYLVVFPQLLLCSAPPKPSERLLAWNSHIFQISLFSYAENLIQVVLCFSYNWIRFSKNNNKIIGLYYTWQFCQQAVWPVWLQEFASPHNKFCLKEFASPQEMIRLATFSAKTGWQMELNRCKVLQKHLLKSLAYARIWGEYDSHRTQVEAFVCFCFPLLPLLLNIQFCISPQKPQKTVQSAGCPHEFVIRHN